MPGYDFAPEKKVAKHGLLLDEGWSLETLCGTIDMPTRETMAPMCWAFVSAPRHQFNPALHQQAAIGQAATGLFWQ